MSASSIPVFADCSVNSVASVVEHSLSKRLSFVRLKMESKIPLSSRQTVAGRAALLRTSIRTCWHVVLGCCSAESMLKTPSEYGRRHLALVQAVWTAKEGFLPFTLLPRLLLERTVSLWRATNLQICAQIRWPWSLGKSNFLVFNSKLKKTAPHPPPCGIFNCPDVMVGDKK